MTGIRSRSESANGRHDLKRSGRRSVTAGNGQPGLVAGSGKSKRPCPVFVMLTLAGTALAHVTFAAFPMLVALTALIQVCDCDNSAEG